ncbi:hypothetical protein BD560DRAFT_422493 [Blakeslea trispora]|nr:hypothetical protein BD560DRAFT_422493 [Blakeslea trispora]
MHVGSSPRISFEPSSVIVQTELTLPNGYRSTSNPLIPCTYFRQSLSIQLGLKLNTWISSLCVWYSETFLFLPLERVCERWYGMSLIIPLLRYMMVSRQMQQKDKDPGFTEGIVLNSSGTQDTLRRTSYCFAQRKFLSSSPKDSVLDGKMAL